MQIGLTGASGFVGREVIRAALRRGHEVVAFSRDPERKVPDAIETRLFRIGEVPDFAGCEAVIHLAGESVNGLWTASKVRRIRESRVEGTRWVAEGVRVAKPEVLVTASGSGYYGDGGEQELTEESRSGDSFLAEVCRAWEGEARKVSDVCRVAHTRFGIILGRNGGAVPLMRSIFRMGLGGPSGSGRQWWTWLHVEDAASLLLFAVENMDAKGPINGAAPWPVRNADFVRVMGKVLHRPTFLRAPAWALRMMLRGFARELLDSRKMVPAAATSLGFPFRFPELEPALRDTLQ
jgi:uncharacterized protein (TIGR01777 family)